ncbi:MAG TPA: hypothetical protein VFT13_05660 [Candidatus Krumholzibacteria bacterium]|nr:hypothetical protein [Candidatus Krumholzibacteria bacterium]
MRRTLVLALALAAFACAKEPAPEQTVDALFFGGTIVTMTAATPAIEAVAVRDGRIVDMGAFKAMHDTHAGALTRMIDLEGGALLPGTIDPAMAADVTGVLATLAPGTAASDRAIEVGKAADFVIFNRNPLDAVAEESGELRIMRIVRGGETVFRAEH